MVNTRALMELIVVNIGYDLGIVPRSVFVMMVFMVVFPSYLTAPLLRHLIRNSEIDEEYTKLAFAGQARRLSWEPGLACAQ